MSIQSDSVNLGESNENFLFVHNGQSVVIADSEASFLKDARKYILLIKKNKKEENYTRCKFVASRGKNKGCQCERMCDPEKFEGFCARHKPKNVNGGEVESLEEEHELPMPVKQVFVETKVRCLYICKKGPSKGIQCTKYSCAGSGFCKKHTKK